MILGRCHKPYAGLPRRCFLNWYPLPPLPSAVHAGLRRRLASRPSQPAPPAAGHPTAVSRGRRRRAGLPHAHAPPKEGKGKGAGGGGVFGTTPAEEGRR